jgi:hypothetical protein
MPPPIASSTPPQPPTDRSRRFAGWWYLPVTILTAGLFAWVPFLHATVRLSRPVLLWWTALYLALATAVVILPVNTTPSDTPDFGSALPGLLAIVVVVAGSIQQWYLRRSLAASATISEAPRLPVMHDPAVAQVLAARTRRKEARTLAAEDPLMARELHIGRPDLPRIFDDGGLVDLNSAPASVIARVCGLDEASAAMIIEARARFGDAFSTVDDVFAITDLPIGTWDLIRDRGITIPR